MEIITALIVLAIISLICAVVLTVAATFFAVKENEKVIAVRECLPGANCGACGYSGCDGYAKALGEGECDNPSLCIPGGDGVAKEIGEIMGLSAGDVVEKVAYVACNGSCKAEERKYVYDGIKTCAAANMSYSGDRDCTFACLGYGDCMKVCPRDAISIDPKKCIAEVDPKDKTAIQVRIADPATCVVKVGNNTVASAVLPVFELGRTAYISGVIRR